MKQQTFLILVISLGLLIIVGFGTYMVVEESRTAEDRAAVERLMQEQQRQAPPPINIESDEGATDSANPTTDPSTTESEQESQLQLDLDTESATNGGEITF